MKNTEKWSKNGVESKSDFSCATQKSTKMWTVGPIQVDKMISKGNEFLTPLTFKDSTSLISSLCAAYFIEMKLHQEPYDAYIDITRWSSFNYALYQFDSNAICTDPR